MGIHTTQARRIGKRMENFVKAVGSKANTVKRKSAEKAFTKLVRRSPVWTGAYVRSHQIGIGKPDLSYVQISFKSRPELWEFSSSPRGLPPRASAGQAASIKNGMMNRKMKLKNVKSTEAIYLTNSVPHAKNVEYLGWPDFKHSPNPYYVYTRTALEMPATIRRMMRIKLDPRLVTRGL